MTIIRDENFPTPAQINELECVSASRHLDRVLESVSVVEICQDSSNPSLVIMGFSLVGAFLFTPYCKILEVDGDTSYTTNDVTAPLALGHFRNADIPINTNCQTVHPELVFDFGRVIPNFLSAQRIRFLVGMVGTIPLSYGVSFPPQTPTVVYMWEKGVLPHPVSMRYIGDRLEVSFQYNGTEDCSCNIQCVTPSGVSREITFCPDDIQTISIIQSLTGDPYSFNISLRDGIGNISDLDVTTLFNVDPQSPMVEFYPSPKRIEISISKLSANGSTLDDFDYQIIKYINSPSNHVIWKDWSERSWSYFIDRDILPNQTYGYSVRYKGRFEDISNFSPWTVITT